MNDQPPSLENLVKQARAAAFEILTARGYTADEAQAALLDVAYTFLDCAEEAHLDIYQELRDSPVPPRNTQRKKKFGKVTRNRLWQVIEQERGLIRYMARTVRKYLEANSKWKFTGPDGEASMSFDDAERLEEALAELKKLTRFAGKSEEASKVRDDA